MRLARYCMCMIQLLYTGGYLDLASLTVLMRNPIPPAYTSRTPAVLTSSIDAYVLKLEVPPTATDLFYVSRLPLPLSLFVPGISLLLGLIPLADDSMSFFLCQAGVDVPLGLDQLRMRDTVICW